MSYLQNSFDLYSIPIHIPYIDLSGGNPNVFNGNPVEKTQPGDSPPVGTGSPESIPHLQASGYD